MIPPFDIFRVEMDGHLVWKSVAETLDLARLRIKILMVSEPAEYLIHSQQTGHRIIVKEDGSVKGRAAHAPALPPANANQVQSGHSSYKYVRFAFGVSQPGVRRDELEELTP